jgi:LysR family carnitine catabolism transcriptional activator
MDLRRLEVFLSVVDEGTFTGAADALGVSQPAVSQAMGALESEVGARLFHRLGRTVRLTDAGAALCDPARLALRDVTVARAAVDAVSNLTAGHLELACLPTLAASPLAPLVGEFRRRHPDVSVSLLDPDDSDGVLGLVRSGMCELGLVGDGPVGGLVAEHLAEQAFRAILPPGSGSEAKLDARALAAMPFVAPPRGSSSRELLDAVLRGDGLEPRVVVETAQREALLPLVLAGAGAALVPEALALVAASLGCVVVDVEPPAGRGVLLVRRPASLTPSAEAFVDVARRGVPPSGAPTERPASSTNPRGGSGRRRSQPPV